MEFLFIALMGKKKSDKSIRHPSSFTILHLTSRKAVKRNTGPFPPIKTKASEITFSAETGLSETLLGPG